VQFDRAQRRLVDAAAALILHRGGARGQNRVEYYTLITANMCAAILLPFVLTIILLFDVAAAAAASRSCREAFIIIEVDDIKTSGKKHMEQEQVSLCGAMHHRAL
jgi:hypothetical protein